MGTTANLKLPYPELTDQANVPVDMKELADQLEANFTPIVGSWTKTTAQTLATATVTIVAWNAPYWGGPVGSISMDGTGVVTLPIPGYYLILSVVTFDTNTTGSRYGYIYVNGASVQRVSALPVAATVPAANMMHIHKAVAGDKIDIRAYQSSGANLTLTTTNYATTFDIVRLSPIPA